MGVVSGITQIIETAQRIAFFRKQQRCVLLRRGGTACGSEVRKENTTVQTMSLGMQTASFARRWNFEHMLETPETVVIYVVLSAVTDFNETEFHTGSEASPVGR